MNEAVFEQVREHLAGVAQEAAVANGVLALLIEPASLLELCMEHGLEAALAQLREHETAACGAGTAVVKRADDASALLWRSGQGRC